MRTLLCFALACFACLCAAPSAEALVNVNQFRRANFRQFVRGHVNQFRAERFRDHRQNIVIVRDRAPLVLRERFVDDYVDPAVLGLNDCNSALAVTDCDVHAQRLRVLRQRQRFTDYGLSSSGLVPGPLGAIADLGLRFLNRDRFRDNRRDFQRFRSRR